ncbi:MAG TPA: LPS export ABC transporter periplasmic protein LptC [Sphingomicrobium sp.]|nr:LPS export ABC transporter periplasmic protein LptC [Sphingomicrobium sp.]
MSEAAVQDRREKRQWAVPGSRHDRIVRLAKIALPVMVGILIAFMALAPLDRSGEGSFILDQNKVANAPERMRVDVARYTGQDNLGRPFAIVAQSAVQRNSDLPIVDIRDMFARLSLPRGPVTMIAELARYNLDTHILKVIGPIRVNGPDGYQLYTRDVTVNLKERSITGTDGVEGAMSLGQFSAGRLRADLGERTVTLDQGARLKIIQRPSTP